MHTPERPTLLQDAGLAVGVAAVSLFFAYPRPGIMAVVLAMCAPLVIRRAYPRVALATLTVAALVHVVTQDSPTVSVVAVPILVHSLARWSTTADARAGLVIALAGAVLGPARWLTDRPEEATVAGWATSVTATAGMVLTVFVAGRRGRDRDEREAQRERERAERRRLELAEHERALEAAAAQARTAVAREVHDIIAHSLSVIAVHAEGGRALTARHPQRAPEVLETIAETARESLDDLRELVAMLRGGGPAAAGRAGASYRPAPGIGDLDELVSRLDGRVRLQVHGNRRQVGPVAGMTLYRVVQESLTNVLRHAGPGAAADVRLDIGERAIDLVVRDDGYGAASATDGRGTGLAAMRERVQLHDGTLTAGPREGGGFEVHAVLPAHRATAGPGR
ncbi:sensor histidine kinase [Jidongwangia harbinensis]|uniref:sensor histidine kinase n=1 Tax=Jidongwangia harbinensis TaxID=2878561 RepID=UPI001CD9F487|nr:histidine kinase [Jidongwangia harbinensis]MCA2211793.1 histidine kinase [Jidongwangia harbinensis]